MLTFSRIDAFEGEGKTLLAYVERIYKFLKAYNVMLQKKRSIFFSCCRPPTYLLLHNLVKLKTLQLNHGNFEECVFMLSSINLLHKSTQTHRYLGVQINSNKKKKRQPNLSEEPFLKLFFLHASYANNYEHSIEAQYYSSKITKFR